MTKLLRRLWCKEWPYSKEESIEILRDHVMNDERFLFDFDDVECDMYYNYTSKMITIVFTDPNMIEFFPIVLVRGLPINGIEMYADFEFERYIRNSNKIRKIF